MICGVYGNPGLSLVAGKRRVHFFQTRNLRYVITDTLLDIITGATSTEESSSRLCLSHSSPSSLSARLDLAESMGLAVWKLPEPGEDERAGDRGREGEREHCTMIHSTPYPNLDGLATTIDYGKKNT